MTLPNDLEKLRDSLAEKYRLEYFDQNAHDFVQGFNACADIFLKREAELKENPHGSDFTKKLIEKLKDLEDQAKTEKSHFYTASLLRETIRHLETNYDDVALKEIFEMQRRDFEHLQYQLSTAMIALGVYAITDDKFPEYGSVARLVLEKLRPSDSEGVK